MPGKWGYQINQWKPLQERILRREQQERAFKQMSVCGFRAVEMQSGSGRWSPLGSAEQIVLNFGSLHNFIDALRSWGVDQVSGMLFDSGQPASNRANHERILNAARPHIEFLREVNGSYLVTSAMGQYWREAPVTDEKIKIAAECWNKLGKLLKMPAFS